MSIEVRPLGVTCNLHCRYCYQTPQRNAKNVLHSYDLEKIKAGIEREGGAFSLFGGEALLVPVEDLETLWAWGLEKYGRNSVQTNGTLITDEHIRLFKNYKVSVGISMDGPGELNDARWTGSQERTRRATAQLQQTIERLCREGVSTSLIVTLHRGNATADKLPRLHDWFKHLEQAGIRYTRLHILESEDDRIRREYALTTQENLVAFHSFLELEQELTDLTIDIFEDMRNILLGQDERMVCTWNGCDPYTTGAVRGIEGNGQRSNCGRTSKDGLDFVKCDTEGFERYLALYYTPQAYGGCRGCRFFIMCKGSCPGTAIDGDWRNRTEYCPVWRELFTHFEGELLAQDQQPLSLREDRPQIEAFLLETWAAGQRVSLSRALKEMSRGRTRAARSQSCHGDVPHGDEHGDHTDHGGGSQSLSGSTLPCPILHA